MSSVERQYELDHLRVIGTFLVILFHVLQPFNPDESWHIQNPERSSLLGGIITYLNIWLLPLFMLLSGAGTHHSMGKRSNFQYVRERTSRIFAPLILGMLSIIPPQVYFERLQSGAFAGNFLDFYPQVFNGPYPKGNFSWHHLWFLAYLFSYSMICIGIFRGLSTTEGKTVLAKLASRCARNPSILWLFALPLIVAQIILGPRFPKTNALLNDWAWHSQLILSFIYGFILNSNRDFTTALRRARFHFTASAILLTIAFLIVRDAESSYATRVILSRAASWISILAILGLAAEYLNTTNRYLAYLAPASLPVYILHQTVIVVLAYYIVSLHLPLAMKVVALGTLTIVSTFTLYEVLKRLSLGRLIIGLK